MYWMPKWDNHEHYGGRVLSSGLGRISVHEPAVWLDPGDEVRRLLREQPVELHFIAGPRTQSISPLLSVHSAGIEFIMLGVLGDDFLYRYWARSDEARLDHANLQLADRLAPFEPGDTVSLTFHFSESGYCLVLNGQRECGRGFAVGDTWTLLISPDWARGPMAVAASLWLWGILLICGLVARDRRALLAVAGVTIVALQFGPQLASFSATPVYQIAAALAGVLTGYVAGGLLQRRGRAAAVAGFLHEPRRPIADAAT
jgi:hypothetical protein